MIDTLRAITKRPGRPLAAALISGCLAILASAVQADPASVPASSPTPAAAATVAPGVQQLTARPMSTPAEPATLPEVRKYCTNIANAASEAHFAWQTTKLNELETRLKAKIKELDDKEAEVRDWIEKRESIEKKASEKLVGIYSKMRPETAATQISALDDDMAAAVLAQLGPRQASAIFNEIVPDRAAKLAGLIAGTAPLADKKL